jgi:hypothetical protein
MDKTGLTCMGEKRLSNMRAHVSRDSVLSVGIQQGRQVGLRGDGAHRTRNAQPVCAIDKRRRQVQHDTAYGRFDPAMSK